MYKGKYLLSLAFSILLAHFCIFAYAKSSLSLWPFPITETEEIISEWFKDKGFGLSRVPLGGASFQIRAVKRDECWQIILKPHSPLATEILPQYTNNNQLNEAKVEELWTYLRQYSKGIERQRGEQKQSIPPPVLSQQKHGVCIKAIKGHGTIQLSGCIIDKEGLIISTAHDLRMGEKVQVILNDGQQFDGLLIGIDIHRDLALIKIDRRLATSVSLEDGRYLLSEGERVYSIDCPISHKESILAGLVNGPPRLSDDLPLWQVKMNVSQGDSGSPVFDSRGNLVGLIKGRYRGTDSVGFLIPMDTIIEFLRNMEP